MINGSYPLNSEILDSIKKPFNDDDKILCLIIKNWLFYGKQLNIPLILVIILGEDTNGWAKVTAWLGVAILVPNEVTTIW